MSSSVILLGPQRHVKLVRQAVEALVPADDARPLAFVTAGWEEREAEDQELREHVGRRAANLAVWERVERIFERDPQLLDAMRQRHDVLRAVQELYRLRLLGLMEPVRELFRREREDALLAAERDDALQMVRQLDAQHVERVAAIHREFDARWRPHERPEVVRERRELQALLRSASCLLIAGGHVSMLLHRLRLFDVLALHGDRPIVAWSAGAMALCERIVLFHDFPPQGSSCTEVMEAGLGVVPHVVVLPHAQKRLDTSDARHVRVFARRFAPAFCALLDPGARLDWDGRGWRAQRGTRRLADSGHVQEIPA